jgi:hypothetical protein
VSSPLEANEGAASAGPRGGIGNGDELRQVDRLNDAVEEGEVRRADVIRRLLRQCTQWAVPETDRGSLEFRLICQIAERPHEHGHKAPANRACADVAAYLATDLAGRGEKPRVTGGRSTAIRSAEDLREETIVSRREAEIGQRATHLVALRRPASPSWLPLGIGDLKQSGSHELLEVKNRKRPAAADGCGRFVAFDWLVPRQDEVIDSAAQRSRQNGNRAERVQAVV